MDNTALSAFLPPLATILAAIITGGAQILVAIINHNGGKPPGRKAWITILRGVKWWITISISTVVAIVAIALVFVTVSDSTHCAITNSGWIPYSNDGLGSTITVKPVLGSDCAIQVSFDLKNDLKSDPPKGGWVAIYKKLKPTSLMWTDGITFSYSGMGNPNTIEFKLIDTKDTPYEVVRQNSTSTSGKTLPLSNPYGELRGPNGKIFNPDDFVLDRIDFSFSNWPLNGDIAGSGNVIIDDIQTVPSRLYWLIIFSPIVAIGFIAWIYISWQKRINKR